MSLNIVVVGCGAVAQRLYAEPLRQLEKRRMLRVVALVDPHLAHLGAMGHAFRRASTFDDLTSVWKKCSIDLTLVLTPAHLHASQAAEAMSHGSHVLCEKPMATTVRDCDQMIAAACQNDRILAIGMIRRFFPAFATLRNLIRKGHLGEVESFDFREGRRFDWDVTTSAAFRNRNAGGAGVLFDIGPHVLDALDWVFGSLQVLSYADDALSGVEANVVMQLQSAKCPGRVQLSWDSPLANELRVHGTKGEAILRVDQFDKLAVNTGGQWAETSVDMAFAADVKPVSPTRLTPRHYGHAITCQLIQTIRAIHFKEAPAVDGATGRKCVALLESALAVARPLEMPWLGHDHQEAYRSLHWTSAT